MWIRWIRNTASEQTWQWRSQDSLLRSTDLRGPNRGPVWRAAPNAANTNAVRAQRGRRGLISYGEAMPEKLTKSQKKSQPKVSNGLGKIPFRSIGIPLRIRRIHMFLGLPDPDPLVQRYGSGSFYHQAK